MINDTIVALSTPKLTSALALIRISGNDAFNVLNKMFSKKIPPFDKRIILIGNIIDESDIVDSVVVSLFKGPNSFTGEDVVEISCHGGVLIINKIISLCIKNGARQAERGEFSQKAFYNNKIDLLQAESINDLIMSKSNLASKMALKGVNGELTQRINDIKDILLEVLANIEVNIDYPEYEDIEILTNDVLMPSCEKMQSLIKKLAKDSEKGLLIKDGINVVLIGKPNAGKSSLLNSLINEDKAIVTDIAGTTRDVVEGSSNINGLLFNFYDTAGIRDPKDQIEAIGVNKSKEAIEKADIVLKVVDGSLSIDKQKQNLDEFDYINKKSITVINKSDLSKESIDGVRVSAINNDIENLKQKLINLIGINTDEIANNAILSNARQIGLLNKANKNIEESIDAIKKMVPIDLVIISLHEALNNLNDILGCNSKEDLDNEIFSKFCIGK